MYTMYMCHMCLHIKKDFEFLLQMWSNFAWDILHFGVRGENNTVFDIFCIKQFQFCDNFFQSNFRFNFSLGSYVEQHKAFDFNSNIWILKSGLCRKKISSIMKWFLSALRVLNIKCIIPPEPRASILNFRSYFNLKSSKWISKITSTLSNYKKNQYCFPGIQALE
jgi:hypothetical protein